MTQTGNQFPKENGTAPSWKCSQPCCPSPHQCRLSIALVGSPQHRTQQSRSWPRSPLTRSLQTEAPPMATSCPHRQLQRRSLAPSCSCGSVCSRACPALPADGLNPFGLVPDSLPDGVMSAWRELLHHRLTGSVRSQAGTALRRPSTGRARIAHVYSKGPACRPCKHRTQRAQSGGQQSGRRSEESFGVESKRETRCGWRRGGGGSPHQYFQSQDLMARFLRLFSNLRHLEIWLCKTPVRNGRGFFSRTHGRPRHSAAFRHQGPGC
ncbi:uncharacterized protein B0I36DRAFT_120064 [Microdochium trichocladiopsis]|uniref:Uncharacterized protein n=1 Tax=Microdochium trichocladiopsis TaxID=1682393 RepID=A0A9P8Y9L4_9PEZI|nr:uncharacterized protein B0I36DRAFT_120064 [Microdochium trichocladiopsis]KAH7031215.1 hypothetical protein B0I36DRAFT_120064 [Microdochium trichocladiopsis]